MRIVHEGDGKITYMGQERTVNEVDLKQLKEEVAGLADELKVLDTEIDDKYPKPGKSAAAKQK
jgi:hypothetical protein